MNIVLISQLKDFSSYIGGEQYERILLPLLIGLCKSDSRANSEAAIDIIKGILKKVDTRRNEDILVETVKKLVESDYFLSKEAAINILTTFLLDVNNPSFFLSLFVQFAESQDYRQRKIAVKNLKVDASICRISSITSHITVGLLKLSPTLFEIGRISSRYLPLMGLWSTFRRTKPSFWSVSKSCSKPTRGGLI